MSRRDRGLTLIELLAAMAILALVSLMAVQTLSGALFQRDILNRTDVQAGDLSLALALLRRDLEAAAPVSLGLDDDLPLPAIAADNGGISLIRTGLGPAPGAFGRVDWRLDAGGVLARRVTIGGVESPWVPVLADLRDLRLGAMAGTMPDESDPLGLPAGFELNFVHAHHGAIRLVVAR